MTKIIGLMGYARSGKDTVAKTLINEFGYTRFAFADALRDAAYVLNPWVNTGPMGSSSCRYEGHGRLQDLVDALGWDEAKKNPEVRRLLQVLGTEVGRNIISPTVWVDIAEREIGKILYAGGKVVITDVRFPNEWHSVRNLGGQMWRVVRPGTEPVNGHSSETALDGYLSHVGIINNHTLDALAYTVRSFASTG